MPEGVLDIMGDDAPGSYRRLLDTSTGEEACEDDMCKVRPAACTRWTKAHCATTHRAGA